MERAFTTGNAPARHPVRRVLSLPAGNAVVSTNWENTRLFLMTFVAGFLAFYGMIA